MNVLTVGMPAIDRDFHTSTGATNVDRNTPAPKSGIITRVEVWLVVNVSNFRVGTFRAVGNILTCITSTPDLGALTTGAKRTLPVSLPITEGDYLGCYSSDGQLELSASGFAGQWSVVAECIDPGDSAELTLNAINALSLQGIGFTLDEGGAGRLIAIGQL